MKNILVLLLASVLSMSCKTPDKVLVFTKTEGFRHDSIETGVKTLQQLGEENGFEVTHTEAANMFSVHNLKQYNLVVFLNTTGNVLNSDQEEAFENYIKNGGSFVGVHSATDTEYKWPWYGKLVGAYFLSHPEQSKAEITVIDANHQSTRHLPNPWSHFDEWYNFKTISPNINILLMLDETSYKGGENGNNHPIAWYQEYDGGRMFYTGLGHTKASYANPVFRKHLLGGMLYCLKRKR